MLGLRRRRAMRRSQPDPRVRRGDAGFIDLVLTSYLHESVQFGLRKRLRFLLPTSSRRFP